MEGQLAPRRAQDLVEGKPVAPEPPVELPARQAQDRRDLSHRRGRRSELHLDFVANDRRKIDWVLTDKISREEAEDQGWNLFLDPKMKSRYVILTYDNWNIIHMCLTAGLNPFVAVEGDDVEKFRMVARQIFAGSKLQSGDMVALNTALINGEIDAYFTGGTYTASPARFDGVKNVRGITPKSGPVDGKGAWCGLN